MVNVIVPAHNEENIIVQTLDSILTQSLKPGKVIVALDNCTDNTEQLVDDYIKQNSDKIITKILTKNNAAKKAGAIDQVLENMDLEGYLLIMDADTIIDNKCLENAAKVLNEDKSIGAVCSRAGILPCTSNKLPERIIHSLQHIEYAQFDSHRVETQGHIKVAHGMCTMFRLEALKDVPSIREHTTKHFVSKDNSIYLKDNLTEDYEMTLCIKHKWKVTSCLDMKAWTDTPVKLKDLYLQRLRWLRGGVDSLRTHGLNKVTWPEIANHLLFVLLTLIRLLMDALLIYVICNGGSFAISGAILAVLFYGEMDTIYRLHYIQGITTLDVTLVILYLPLVFYNWFQAAIMIHSYINSFFNIEQKW